MIWPGTGDAGAIVRRGWAGAVLSLWGTRNVKSRRAWLGCIAGAALLGSMSSAGAQDAQQEGQAPREPNAIDVYDPDVAAADLAAGEDLYQTVCRNCHGPTAKGMASFPRLAGHDAQFLSTQLAEYRAGETLGPNTLLMAPHAKKLSDADIVNLAAYIADEFD